MGFFSKNTGVGCHFLLQRIFPTQGSNLQVPCLLHCRWFLYPLSHQGSPKQRIQNVSAGAGEEKKQGYQDNSKCLSSHFLTWLPCGQGWPPTCTWQKSEVNLFSSGVPQKEFRLHYLGAHVRQSVPAFCLLLLWFVVRYLCCSQIYSHLQSVSFSVCIKCGPLEKHKMLEMYSVGNMRSQLYVMCA